MASELLTVYIISDAQIIFDHCQIHTRILQLLWGSNECLRTLEHQDRVPPDSAEQDEAARFYYYIMAEFTYLTQFKMSFWNTSRDHFDYLGSLAERPMKRLKQLELCIGIHDIINMPQFKAAFKDKLETIEQLGIFPKLKVIKLVPSRWVSPSDPAHHKAFWRLIAAIPMAWTNAVSEDFFGWKTLIDHQVPITFEECVFKWRSGVVLDITEIRGFCWEGRDNRRLDKRDITVVAANGKRG